MVNIILKTSHWTQWKLFWLSIKLTIGYSSNKRKRPFYLSKISIAKFYVVSKTSLPVRTFMYRSFKTFSNWYFTISVFPSALVKSSKVISYKEGGPKGIQTDLILEFQKHLWMYLIHRLRSVLFLSFSTVLWSFLPYIWSSWNAMLSFEKDCSLKAFNEKVGIEG